MIKKAIVVVSFGTSYEDTRKKTIDKIENDIERAYPDYKIYRAFTSKIIINILKKRDKIHVDTVKETMEKMKSDGIEDIIIQPTHVINGIENDKMIEDVLIYKNKFNSIIFGSPLLNATKDYEKVIEGFVKELPQEGKDTAFICMGHGTDHYTNSCYSALDYMFKDYGYENIYMATVEAYPAIETVIEQLKKKSYKNIILIPFMVVAGDHAKNDMAGEDEDSWKNLLRKEGYNISCIMRGLGEYKFIRDIYVEHIKDAQSI